MILKFPSRYTPDWRDVGGEVEIKKISLAGMSRLLLDDTMEYDSRKDLQILVWKQISSLLEKHCDEFYGTEKWKNQRDFSESLKAIILLVKSNLYDVIEWFNGEKSKAQELAWLFKMDYDLSESWVKKNAIFGTNTRIFIASCFRNERLSWMINDISECLQVQSGQLPFQHMMKRFHYELRKFASDTVRPIEKDDMYQEGCIVLWNCINKYSGQNFIPLRQYFLRSLKNKSIDMLRSMGADKRKISLKTTSSSAESFNESQAHREVAKRYANWYYEWLNSADDDENKSFIAPSSVGEYFPEAWKSITEAHVNKTVDDIFSDTVAELMLYIKTQIPEDHFKKLKEFFSHTHLEMIFLRFLFGNPREDRGLDIMQQDFLRAHMKWCVFFDGEKYCFQKLSDLQETFLMMCQEIIEKDPMIQLALSRKWTIHDIELPF